MRMSLRTFPKCIVPLLGFALFGGIIEANAFLLIYYPLNETSGNVAIDAAISDGLQNATATVVASNWQAAGGILGGAIQFSPTSQTDVDEALIYNTASASTSILGSNPFTLSIWVKTTDTTNQNHAAIFLGEGNAFDHYYALGTSGAAVAQMIARSSSANVITTTTGAINDGNWHNLVAVFSAPNSRTIYVDGRMAGSTVTSVAHPILNRFSIGALTRSSQTDAFSGLADEAGLFDTALTAPEAALLNAFPRYDNVPLDDTDFALALSVFNTQTGSVTTGTWTWNFASGLTGTLGTTGLSGGSPFVVLDNSGNGLIAVPEPSVSIIACAATLFPLLRRRRTMAA
jgi:hypothetical protein